MSDDMEYGPFEVDQHITAHSRYCAGKIGSLFYTMLRDEEKILGVKCARCNKVFWPPRETCGRCFSKLSEADMVEIGPNGTLETFTLVTYKERIHPREAPFVYGIIRLDGADTGMAHFIDEVPYEELKIGMKVRPVFSEERRGNILDIKHFKPL
jgi:uncharacterized OB-fold protein